MIKGIIIFTVGMHIMNIIIHRKRYKRGVTNYDKR